MRKKIIYNIVISSLLAAMAVVLEKIGIKIPLMGSMPTLRISFYGLPLMIAGIIFGLKTGIISGFITAFITQIILSVYLDSVNPNEQWDYKDVTIRKILFLC